MKSIFLSAALLLLGHALYAQNSSRLTVRNTTPCTMYFSIVASVPVTPGAPSCTIGATSSVIAIPPGGLFSFSGNSLPAVTPPPAGSSRVILGGIVYSGPAGCELPATKISSWGCLVWPSGTGINVNDASCTLCTQTLATWGFSQAQNTLLFN